MPCFVFSLFCANATCNRYLLSTVNEPSHLTLAVFFFFVLRVVVMLHVRTTFALSLHDTFHMRLLTKKKNSFVRFLGHPPSADVVQQNRLTIEIAAVEQGIKSVEAAIARNRAACLPDQFGRVPADMPPCMRHAYDTGTWKNSKVYMWELVLELSRAGHRLASDAEKGLAHISYRPPPGLNQDAQQLMRAENSKAVADAVAVHTRIKKKMKQEIARRRAKRVANMRALTREYMQLRREWNARLDRVEAQRSVERKEALRERDRELLIATRAPSGMGSGMSIRETNQMFAEIDAAGGTAGGLERWGRSITAIPDQNPNYLPPAADGGGVLIENPLEEHYSARNINPWTQAERLLFLEKFLVYNKNFRKIASFFKHKSVEDVVRFYFDNKMPLKLKQLWKDSLQKRRAPKRNALIELSKLPVESRSIRDNFIHQRVARPLESEGSVTVVKDFDDLAQLPASRGWTAKDHQRLLFALCRFDVTGKNSSSSTTAAWSNISSVVGTKTPIQCRQFYANFRKSLGLEEYAPPKVGKELPSKRVSTDVDRAPTLTSRKHARITSYEVSKSAVTLHQPTASPSISM